MPCAGYAATSVIKLILGEMGYGFSTRVNELPAEAVNTTYNAMVVHVHVGKHLSD